MFMPPLYKQSAKAELCMNWRSIWDAFIRMLIRLQKSNNRSLGTVFGSIVGLVLGIILVTQHAIYSLPFIGTNNTTIYQIIGVVLAIGMGSNLSSFIGATFDILFNEYTIIDFITMIISKKEHKDNLDEPPVTMKELKSQHDQYPSIQSGKEAEHK